MATPDMRSSLSQKRSNRITELFQAHVVICLAVIVVITAILTVQIVLAFQRLHTAFSAEFLRTVVAIPWEHREPIAYVVGVAAFILGSRQFLDARYHSGLLEKVTTSLAASADQLAKQITSLNHGVAGIRDNTQKIIDAVEGVQREAVRLEGAIENIDRALHTIPPGDFVEQFSARITNMYTRWLPTLREGDLGAKPEDALIELIHRLLHAVASLALEYDLRKARYAANIMLYIPRDQDGIAFGRVSPDLLRRFFPAPLGLQHFEGILLLIEDLAVTLHPDDAPNEIHQDDKIEPVVFGVPPLDACREGVRWRVLPGAPLAFVKWDELQTSTGTGTSASLLDAVQGHDDVSRLGKINEEGVNANKFDVSEHILRAICAYYESTESGRRVKSFISFPLPSPDSNGSKAFGVMNIHCDQPTF